MKKNAVLVSLLLLFAPIAIVQAASERRVHKSLALDANGQLSISTHNGLVTVTAWNQPRVDVDATIVPDLMNDQEDVDGTDIRITGSGASVRVESNYDRVPDRGWFGFRNRSLPAVNYTISVPATASVKIDAHNSTIQVSGLHNDLRVVSHNGPIDVTGLDGAVDIDTHNGDVSVAFARFARSSRIETHNGGIDVRIPAGAAFHVEADGHRLSFDSDFAIATRWLDRSRVVGDANGGGPPLRFSTHNGSVRIRKS